MFPFLILLSCGVKEKAVTQPTISNPKDKTIQDVDLYLSELRDNDLMHGSVVLMHKGRILFQKAYGTLDAKGVHKANVETVSHCICQQNVCSSYDLSAGR